MRRIVFVVDTISEEEDARRVDALIVAATELGFKTTSNQRVVSAGEPLELFDHFRDAQSRQLVIDSGFTTIAEFASLTAYEAWRLFGGTPARDEFNTVCRGKGKTFTVICRLLANNDQQFQDLDPKTFQQYSKAAWQQLGADRLLAGVLEGVEIFDVRILNSLTEKDLENIRCSPFLHEDLRQLHSRLRTK